MKNDMNITNNRNGTGGNARSSRKNLSGSLSPDTRIEVPGCSGYYVDRFLNVYHGSIELKANPVGIKSNDGRKLSINRTRLYVLSQKGISPFDAKGKEVFIFRKNGSVVFETRAERQEMLNKRRRYGVVCDAIEYKKKIYTSIKISEATIAAIDGDPSGLLSILESMNGYFYSIVKSRVKDEDTCQDLVSETKSELIREIMECHKVRNTLVSMRNTCLSVVRRYLEERAKFAQNHIV